VVARVSDHLSQFTSLEIVHPKTDEHVNPSVEVHHLVGKLSTAETLLNEVQRNKCLKSGKDFYTHPVYEIQRKRTYLVLKTSTENTGARGNTVVKVLCYKSEGRWFDPSWWQWIFH